jgi:hypothetical protein
LAGLRIWKDAGATLLCARVDLEMAVVCSKVTYDLVGILIFRSSRVFSQCYENLKSSRLTAGCRSSSYVVRRATSVMAYPQSHTIAGNTAQLNADQDVADVIHVIF